MSQSTPEVTEFDDRIVVEAPTAEAALEAVTERFGTRARIAKVEQVRRGGVAGFFARELVQVVATPQPGPDAPPGDPTSGTAAPDAADAIPTAPPVAGLGAALSDATIDPLDGVADGGFAGVLRQHLSAPVAGAGDDAPTDRARPAEVAAAVPSPQLPGTPRWSVDNLRRLGLPRQVVDAAARLEPTDDAGWTYALARGLEQLCVDAPPRADVIVGPAALELAAAYDLPVCWPGEPPPPGTFVAPIPDAPAARAWLASVRAGRRLHLVVGGRRWRGLLFDRPQMVSSADASGLCETLRVAAELRVALGVTRHAGAHFERANPVGLAVAVRAQLPVVDRR